MTKKRSPTTTPNWQAAVRRRTRFYTLIAVLLAALFGFLVFQFFTHQNTRYPGDTIAALYANTNIPAGTILTEDMLLVKNMPRQALPDNLLSFKEQAVGQLTLYPMIEGEVILPTKLASSSGGILAQRCPAQKWCVSIPAAWFLAPPPDLAEGDQVEIASAFPGKNPAETGFIATQVLIVGLPEDAGNPAYVLAVDGEEALNLLYARVNEFQLLVFLRPAGG